MNVWQKLEGMDRRILFLLVIFAVVIPLMNPMGLPLSISPYTRQAYETIENLPEGSIVIMSPAYNPGSEAELLPQNVAQVHHLMSRGIKLIWVSLAADSPMYARKIMDEMAPEYNYEYGRDYIIMPFTAGEEPTVASIGHDLRGLYTEDVNGVPLTNFELWAEVNSIKDIALIVDFITGNSMLYFVRLVHTVHGTPVTGGATGVVTPILTPHIQAGQISGVLSGLRGAAEYEILIRRPGNGASGMDAQSLTHALLILFIIMGNIGERMISRSGKGAK